jgi:hypothetical protein
MTSHADIRRLNRRPGQSRMTVIHREGPLSSGAGSGGEPLCRILQSRVLRIVPTFTRPPSRLDYESLGFMLSRDPRGHLRN